MTSHPLQADSTPLDLTELKRLIAALSDGQLQPAERDRLEQMMRTHAEARGIYVAYMQLDAGLDWKIRGRELVGAMVHPSLDGKGDSAGDEGPGTAPRTQTSRAMRTVYYAAGALAASLLVGLGSYLWMSSMGGPAGFGPQADVAAAVQDEVVARVVELSEECGWFVENRRNGDGMLVPGDKVRLTRGRLRLEFLCGATVTMKSPAALEVIAPMRTRAVLGTLTAHIEKGAEGFTIETPRTTVVDLGTDFGIDVSDHGSTDVVVFTGEVDLHSDGVEGLKDRQRLKAGEGVHVSGEGTASRIVSITDSRFAIGDGAAASEPQTPIISDVRDNIQRGESWHFYEIVHGGMCDDAKAFVDRKDHEWNGIDADGIPSYLIGGDYVKTFNDDKLNREVEIQVTVDRPAALFVLLDWRSPAPHWLREAFYNTGDIIGMDGGGYRRDNVRRRTGVGPGKSIDDRFVIWRRDVLEPGTLKLGAIHIGGVKHNMYGIVAVPLEMLDGSDDASVATKATAASTPLVTGTDGELAAERVLERPTDKHKFSFRWPGGPAQVECERAGSTALDVVVAVLDSADNLVGYAESIGSPNREASVLMNLPPGHYSVHVQGAGEIGDVGAYRLTVKSSDSEVPPALPTSEDLILDTRATAEVVELSWTDLSIGAMYRVETSRDGVNYSTLSMTSETSALDTGLQPGESRIYRVQAEGASHAVSAPARVRARASAVSELQTFGHGPEWIRLDWQDVRGDQGYRVERSDDGVSFATIATAPPNSNGYRDAEIEPGRRYAYRIVTIDERGDGAVSMTLPAFSGVGDLSASMVDGRRVQLRWQSSYPSETRLYLERAAGEGDFALLGSVAADRHEFLDERPPVGQPLRYRLRVVEDVETLTDGKTVDSDVVRIPEWVDESNFALRFRGKLKIEKFGNYYFGLSSDDGSRLYINGMAVIENDGRHALQEVTSRVGLAAGEHDFEVQYFQIEGQQSLEWCRLAQNVRIELQDSMFRSLTCQYYPGRFARLPFVKVVALSNVAATATAAAASTSAAE